MNPIEIYHLFNDANNHELRVKKVKCLLRKAYRCGDVHSTKKIEGYLSEMYILSERLEKFFSEYIKKN